MSRRPSGSGNSGLVTWRTKLLGLNGGSGDTVALAGDATPATLACAAGVTGASASAGWSGLSSGPHAWVSRVARMRQVVTIGKAGMVDLRMRLFGPWLDCGCGR